MEYTETESDTRPDIALSGYGCRAYAESLHEYGSSVHLPRAEGFLLQRPIGETGWHDAMGCYPLFACKDWSALAGDLEALRQELVSVCMVADPFGALTPADLDAAFDRVALFKSHYVVDLALPSDQIGSKRHQKQARAALRKMDVEVCRDPAGFVGEWSVLYGNLCRRHGIRGMKAFSKSAFARQLAMPGLVVLQAFMDSQLVGAQLYVRQGDVIHCHLGAVSDLGYKHGAFYAMDLYSFGHFSGMGRWLDLGGGAGVTIDGEDGLSKYKRGWSTETRPVYFCSKILNREKYDQLVLAEGIGDTDYFPAYRQGEFG